MKRGAPLLFAFLCVLVCALLCAACGGPPPSLPPVDILVEKEVSDLKVGLIDLERPSKEIRLYERMEELEVPGVSIALLQEGELRWARAFGETADGEALDPATPVAAGEMLDALNALLASRLRQSFDEVQGEPKRLRKEILEPLEMTNSSVRQGTLHTTAEDLAKVVVDLQKAHAGKPARRLDQAQAQMFFGTGRFAEIVIDSVPPIVYPFQIAGEGQARHFERRATTATHLLHLVGFVYSGHGAVVIANDPQAGDLVDEILAGLAEIYDWPAYRVEPEESAPDLPSDP